MIVGCMLEDDRMAYCWFRPEFERWPDRAVVLALQSLVLMYFPHHDAAFFERRLCHNS